jgi:predicted nucleic acid-binding protein
LLRKAAEIAIPVIVLGEYRYGIALSRHRQRYEQWLTEYLSAFQVLDIDERTTVTYAVVRTELRKAGTPIPSNDAWIAALCRQHALPLVSRDIHFDHVAGLERLGW